MTATIVQQNSGDTTTTTPTSYTVTLPAGTVVGNWLIIVVTADATVNTPAGFTLDRSQVNNAGHYVFRKATVDAETSWTVSPTSGASGCWWVAEVSGLASASPVDQVTSQGQAANSATWSTGTTAATTQADDWALASWSSSAAAGTAVSATSMSNGFTEVADRRTTKASGTNVSIAVGTKDLSATGTVESTVSWAPATNTQAPTGIMLVYKVAGIVVPPAPPHALSDRYWRAGKPVRPAPFKPAGSWPPEVGKRFKGGD